MSFRRRGDPLWIPTSTALSKIPNKTVVKAAGHVVMHQAPPTAKGHDFITLEDEEGMMNIIVRPDMYARFDQILSGFPLLLIEGQIQKKGSVVNVLLHGVSPLMT